MIVRQLTLTNKRGLHARASAKFVKLTGSFDATISVERDDFKVSGRSIMGLMLLAAACGDTITVTAEGPEAQDALDALDALLARKFDEEDD